MSALHPDQSQIGVRRLAWYWAGKVRQFGGAERVVLEGLRCFREMGVTATLLMQEPESSWTGRLFAPVAAEVKSIVGFGVPDRPYPWFQRPGRFVGRVRALRRVLKDLNPPVILVNGQHECLSLWIHSLFGTLQLPPVVTFIHGSPFQFIDEESKYSLALRRNFARIREGDPVYRELIPARAPRMGLMQRVAFELANFATKKAVRMSRLILVLSEKNRKEVELLYGTRAVDVVCPGGYDRQHLGRSLGATLPSSVAASGGPVLLSVSRLVAKKRVDLVLRAFAAWIIESSQARASLWVVGEGPERARLEEAARALGVCDRVHFLGFVSDDELCALYDACDVFVSADNADYDLTVMAALPHGKRIVVSRQYDIPASLTRLSRFFFRAEPTPSGFARTIGVALRAGVAELAAADSDELDSLCWERYFAEVVQRLSRAVH